jgi:hypothetical protein
MLTTKEVIAKVARLQRTSSSTQRDLILKDQRMRDVLSVAPII